MDAVIKNVPRIFKRLTPLNPDQMIFRGRGLSPDRILISADRARDQRRWENAATLYRRYLEMKPADAAIWVQLGHALKEQGQFAAASKAYRRGLALRPDIADTHLQLGHLLKIRGDRTGALKSYSEALRLDPLLDAAAREAAVPLAGDHAVADREANGVGPKPLLIEELDEAARAFGSMSADGGKGWAEYSTRVLRLPDGFDLGLDPLSEAYRSQQLDLWRQVSGISSTYRPADHELTGALTQFDPIRRPGFYAARHAGAVAFAGDQTIALGHILKCSKLTAGDWVLEYGAGFGQIALALARLGVHVDTVDIDPEFCAAVRAQADFYDVDLTPFQAEFGFNPRRDQKYDLILFYESFHHCLDFLQLIPTMKNYLSHGGRVILAGEPIIDGDSPVAPYPWGLRLDAECVAVVRQRGWLELGFTVDFLIPQFIRHGFLWRRHRNELSHWADAHEFFLRSDKIDLENHNFPPAEDETWNSRQTGGRFTREISYMTIDCSMSYTYVELHLHNHHPVPIEVSISVGDFEASNIYPPHRSARLRIPATAVTGPLRLESDARRPSDFGSEDARLLGIFVETLRFSSEQPSEPAIEGPLG